MLLNTMCFSSKCLRKFLMGVCKFSLIISNYFSKHPHKMFSSNLQKYGFPTYLVCLTTGKLSDEKQSKVVFGCFNRMKICCSGDESF